MTAGRQWASCGAMILTGDPSGPPLFPHSTAASTADRAASIFGLDAGLLSERAHHRGLGRAGRISVGGASRLLRARDGWMCLSLPRADDLELLPALLGIDVSSPEHVWHQVEEVVAERAAEEVNARAQLLSVACSILGEHSPNDAGAVRHSAGFTGTIDLRDVLVVDMSALWAGPLCAHLLSLAGARTVKVEDRRRPDGARRGSREFYDLLNQGKQSFLVDISSPKERADLEDLVGRADVLVTSARSRAFEQFGWDPRALFARGRPLVWVAVTAYGWTCDRIGFGDDVAAAAGLVAWTPDSGEPVFASDAIADPLCGLLAAERAVAELAAGRSAFIDAALVSAAAAGAAAGTPRALPATRDDTGWTFAGASLDQPRVRRPQAPAREPGADNEFILTELHR